MLDRLDLHIEVPWVEFKELHRSPVSETSVDVQKRVLISSSMPMGTLGRKPNLELSFLRLYAIP
ncbi:hypothetical protein [Desulfitobacterium hafniense]|uniref:Uncharacterized protein n=1 Tax=Desulfitobacterium hafniense DP7 TaxID=537010 RepID=G9XUB5_DESHA|nr:hypothetical protein [Desulfitobacterium hafniense]EHL04792.1 hypothetical protein HMPREF0322_04573 [Desulfitobacterium hafniense DP7]MEA5025390.1 hypothetical protein [Desulfitobacterium hafniense]